MRVAMEPAPRTPPRSFALAAVALAALLAAIHLWGPVRAAPLHAPLNYNEGWIAYNAARLLKGEPLYPGPQSLLPNNYPPLGYHLLAWATPLTPDLVMSGRFFALLGLFASALLLGAVAARVAGSAAAGAFAGLAFLAGMGANYAGYVGTSDPQLLAHAFVLAGAALLVRSRAFASLLAAAVLMAVGGLVKHNIVALPLALTAWLGWTDRVALRRWLPVAAGAVAVGLGLALLAHGEAFLASLLGERASSLERAVTRGGRWLAQLEAPLALALVGALALAREVEARLPLLFLGFSLVVGLGFAAGAGTNYNMIFELWLALALFASLVIGRAPRRLQLALAAAFLMGPLVAAPATVLERRADGAYLAQLQGDTRADVAYLSARGPALCETLSLCYWAGKPRAVDLYGSRQAFMTGTLDEEELLGRIRRREFAVVQLTQARPNRDDERVSQRFMSELQRAYVPDRASANGVFLRPRP
jgi:hypothetical protein